MTAARPAVAEGLLRMSRQRLADLVWKLTLPSGFQFRFQDIETKMANKARNGGAISKAKVGYAVMAPPSATMCV